VHVYLYDDGTDILRVVATRTVTVEETRFVEVEQDVVTGHDDDGEPIVTTSRNVVPQTVQVEQQQEFVAYGWVSALSNHYDPNAYGADGQLRDPDQDDAAHSLHTAELAHADLLENDALEVLPRDLEDATAAKEQLLESDTFDKLRDQLVAAEADKGYEPTALEELRDRVNAAEQAETRVADLEQRIAAAEQARADAVDTAGRAKAALAEAEKRARPGVGKPRQMTDDEVRAYALGLLAAQCAGFADETASPAAPLREFEV
jgi:hypothetical protein